MALPLLAAGLGLQAGSSLVQGFLGSNQKKDEAAIAKYNAAITRQNAEMVKKRVRFQQSRQAEMGARILGEKEAALGGSGLVTTEGAPMLSLALQESELELENFLIGQQGQEEINQLVSQAQGYDIMAKQAKKGARQSLVGGFLGAGASGLMAWSQIPKTTTPGVPSWGAEGYSMNQLRQPGFYGV